MNLAFFVMAFALLEGATADCPPIFERYCSDHSYCLPANASCKIIAYYPTKDDKNLIVELHNKYRSMIALGTQGLPGATNMMEMEWDDELAIVAQKYADQCIYQHDHANCRRVLNFGVGQNLAIQTLTGGHTAPQPDWNFATSIWYSEIIYFEYKDIFPFDMPKGGEYRHFTQMIWATSFRVGCGYVLYTTGSTFTEQTLTRLYVCNYGPAGNVYGDSVYEEGNSCSNCPINSCCGRSCGYENIDSGLCKRIDTLPPKYPPPHPNLFYCGFLNDPDCDNFIDGAPNWTIQPTLAGNHLGVVLNGGQNSTITLKKAIHPTQPSFCVSIIYRKGPNKDGDEAANQASLVLAVPVLEYTHLQPLEDYPNPERQQFSIYNLTLSWGEETTLKLNFQVPDGKPAQFFDVQSILAVEGACENKP